MTKRDEIPECLDPEFKKLCEQIRNWRPNFCIGERVRRRFLGGPSVGTVKRFLWKGTHLCCEVEFPNRIESFHAGEYVRADGEQEREGK